MSVFLPAGNGTNVCQALQARVNMRPPIDVSFNVMVGLNVAFSSLYVISIPILFWLRNEPRFSKIRPFWLSLSLMFVGVFYTQGCLLPSTMIGFPCALELFLHVMGSAAGTAVTTARAFVFVMESQYAVSVNTREAFVIQDTASTISSVLLVGFGFKKLESLSIDTLGKIRREYLKIFFLITTPPFVVYAIGVLAVTQYRNGCTDCPMSMEFIIIVMTTPSLTVIFIVRMLLLAYRVKQDQQEIRQELTLILLSVPYWSYLGYALELADPNHVSFDRQFSFQILTCIGIVFFWLHAVVLQVIRALLFKRDRERRARGKSMSSSKTFIEECAADPRLKEDFQNYVAARYAIEHLNFVDDVLAYKNRYEDQPEKWRRSKARNIINTYIKYGAAQEVNIPSSIRDATLIVDIEKSSRLMYMFDPALEEVVRMINTGLWLDFKNYKNKRGSKNAIVATSGIL